MKCSTNGVYSDNRPNSACGASLEIQKLKLGGGRQGWFQNLYKLQSTFEAELTGVIHAIDY